MDEFHTGGQFHMAQPRMTRKAGRGQGQHRAQALAARRHDMSGQLGNQGDLAVHTVDDGLVDPFQILVHQADQGIQSTAFL